jgi:hypothetical protein
VVAVFHSVGVDNLDSPVGPFQWKFEFVNAVAIFYLVDEAGVVIGVFGRLVQEGKDCFEERESVLSHGFLVLHTVTSGTRRCRGVSGLRYVGSDGFTSTLGSVCGSMSYTGHDNRAARRRFPTVWVPAEFAGYSRVKFV